MKKTSIARAATAGVIISSLWLAGCGSDSDGKSASSSSAALSSSVTVSSTPVSSVTSSLSSSSVPSVTLLRGQFIDSPVANFRYTSSLRGEVNFITDADGYFEFVEGDTITFYIGNHALPSIPAALLLTPLSYSTLGDIHDPVVANIARLLQTLDTNGDPSDGITLGDIAQNAGLIDFNLDVAAFAAQPALIELLAAKGLTLISVDQALSHLSESLDVDYSLSSFDCTSIQSYYCNDFSTGADGWALIPETTNSLKPDGVLEWKKIEANGMLRYTAASKGGVIALLGASQMANVPSANYAVEARFRPRENGTTGNKQLYLVLRYQDGNNWYGAALNVQNDPVATQVEIVKMLNNSISRPKQVKRPIHQGKRDATDGVWYELRAEINDNQIRAYLDGELVAEWEDASSPFTDKGTIGIWTANKSFEFDDVRIIDAATKPVSVTISPNIIQYKAEAGDAPLAITVNSTDSAGQPAAFTVISSNPEVVSVLATGDQITLTPKAQGTATISVQSGLNSARMRTIQAEIAPQFILSTSSYPLEGRTLPAVNATGVYEDQPLSITFDNPVELGSFGLVRIFDTDTGALVDSISLIDEKDTLGVVGQTTRTINTRAIMAQGKQLLIMPHAGKLAPGKSYWVAFSESLIKPNSIGEKVFDGLGEVAGWKFSTRAQAPSANLTQVVVDDNGDSADFRRVQSALNYAMQNASVESILIKDGVYSEPLYLRARNNLKIIGESRENTIVRYPNNNGLNPSTEARALFLIAASDLITLENFTIHNSTLIGQGGQAETIYFNSDNGRLLARNMNFLSEQDTILVKGWSFFYNSLIAGNVDFIWGYAKAALFEKSEIRTLGDSRGNGNGGYILQARVEQPTDKGFVFLNSRLTQAPGPLNHPVEAGKTYLARSGGNGQYSDNIVFVNTKMDTHIAAIGWAGLGVANQPVHSPSPSTAVAGWREYGSQTLSGEPLSTADRQFGIALTQAEVEAGYCSRAQVFAAFNSGEGWNPEPEDVSDCVDIDGVNPPSSSSESSASSSATSESNGESSSSAPAIGESSSSVSSEAVGGGQSSASSSSAAGPITTRWTPNITALNNLVVSAPSAGGNSNFNATAEPVLTGGIKLYSASAGSLRLHLANDESYAINYNGTSINGDTKDTAFTFVEGVSGVTPTTLNAKGGVTRFVSVPVNIGSNPVTISISYSNGSATSADACNKGQIALVDQTGKAWKVQSSCSNPEKSVMTATINDALVTELYVLMSRNGDGGGGIRIWSIDITQ